MTDKASGVFAGGWGSEVAQTAQNKIAAAAIQIGMLVSDSAAGSGEYDLRVTTTTTTNVTLRGVAIQGDARGTFGGTILNVAAAAGDGVVIGVLGRCKVLVDGSTSAISTGDPIGASTVTAGYGAKALAGSTVIGRALQASSAYGDYILVDIRWEGVL